MGAQILWAQTRSLAAGAGCAGVYGSAVHSSTPSVLSKLACANPSLVHGFKGLLREALGSKG